MLHEIHPDDTKFFYIAPRIYIGTYHASRDKTLLFKHEIGLVINVIGDTGKDSQTLKLYDELKIEEFKLNIDDDGESDIIKLSKQCYEKITNYINKTQFDHQDPPNILIHCFMAVSRSVAVLLYYLVNSKQVDSIDEALLLVKKSKKDARPNNGFMIQLEDYFDTT